MTFPQRRGSMRQGSIRKIARQLGVVCESDSQVAGYQIDSRLVRPGDLFFALKGEKTNGHFFLGEVKERGGIAAVVSKGYQGPDFGLILLGVEDVAGSLGDLARFFLAESGVQIVGVTGSVAKTTAKEFIVALLGGKFRVGKSLASYNTELTFPLSLLNRGGEEEVIVLEMGTSKPGDLGRLLAIAPPDIALITKVGLAHAAFFPGGISEIAKEKSAIFSHPKTKVAIFHHLLYEFPEALSAIQGNKVSFSLEERGADYFLSKNGDHFLIDERGIRAYQFDLPFKEWPILHTFLAAVSVARQMKMEWDEIQQQIGKLELPKMRFERFERKGVSWINDAYNANPESMRAALSSLPEPKEGGKRIAALATMKELGSFSQEAHRDVGRFAQKYVDHLLVLGEEAAPLCEGFSEVKKPAEFFLDHKSLADRLASLMSPGDVVLVKGSRSMKMETILELLFG